MTKKMDDAIAEAKKRLPIIDGIMRERENQDRQWGGAKHDDAHSPNDWAAFRGKFENRQIRYGHGEELQAQRESLVKLAALCVAQIEAIDRAVAREAEVATGFRENS